MDNAAATKDDASRHFLFCRTNSGITMGSIHGCTSVRTSNYIVYKKHLQETNWLENHVLILSPVFGFSNFLNKKRQIDQGSPDPGVSLNKKQTNKIGKSKESRGFTSRSLSLHF